MINLELPEELEKSREATHGLARDIFRPISRKYDQREHEYPKELDILRPPPLPKGKAAETKKEKAPKAESRPKPDRPSHRNLSGVVNIEELCWGDMGFMLTYPGASLGNAVISSLGTPEQKARLGSNWTALAMTEPQSGSDSASIRTTAVLDGDEWVLNGEKIFVTCADRCEAVVVWASLDPGAGKAGIKPLVVEKGTPGFKLDRLERKLGIRASDTGAFVLTDCRIPRDNLLGSPEIQRNKGFADVMQTFDSSRPAVASMALGVARAALEFTRETMEENGLSFDYHRNTNNTSSLEKEFYRLEAQVEAIRLLIWRAAHLADVGIRNSLQASMCKAKAGKAGTRVVQKCCELLGPLGLSQKYLLEKWVRDVKITNIFEGTEQIQHLIVARQLMKLSSQELK
ncbi:MAG: acyl-CoA dehydrogenase [Proteobacteria bacterium]|nr:acyl-CoA dehydrogenase [Pseudomonadota bacterium]